MVFGLKAFLIGVVLDWGGSFGHLEMLGNSSADRGQ